MSSFDDLLAELSRVLLALDATDEADAAARARLEARRDELREVLREVDIDARRPTAELLEEHTRLEARLEAARNERVKKIHGKYLGATQTVGGGGSSEKPQAFTERRQRFVSSAAFQLRMTTASFIVFPLKACCLQSSFTDPALRGSATTTS